MTDEAKAGISGETQRSATGLRDWLIILIMAALFICYGLFLFFAVGDKGPPSWDFGVVEDIPGQSIYSTHPLGASEPEPQHVSERPSQALSDAGKGNDR